jgi:hypothetical protein
MVCHGEFAIDEGYKIELTEEDRTQLERYENGSEAISQAEREAVVRGVQKYGIGAWAKIISDNPGVFRKPTVDDVKVRTCVYVCMYACMHACMHAYIHTDKRRIHGSPGFSMQLTDPLVPVPDCSLIN